MPRKIPYLQRRGDSYSFRIAVPKDLHKAIGTRELTKALSTQDRRIATPIALSLAAKAKQLFINLRNMTNQKPPANSFEFILEVSLDELGMPDGFKINAEPHESDVVSSATRKQRHDIGNTFGLGCQPTKVNQCCAKTGIQ